MFYERIVWSSLFRVRERLWYKKIHLSTLGVFRRNLKMFLKRLKIVFRWIYTFFKIYTKIILCQCRCMVPRKLAGVFLNIFYLFCQLTFFENHMHLVKIDIKGLEQSVRHHAELIYFVWSIHPSLKIHDTSFTCKEDIDPT